MHLYHIMNYKSVGRDTYNMKKNQAIVTTSMARDDFSIDGRYKKDCRICTCSNDMSMTPNYISDETSIYEYDYDCLSEKEQ